MAEMKTANGLIIMKGDLNLGGFRIDLYRPRGEDPKMGIYAEILRGEVLEDGIAKTLKPLLQV